MKLLIWIMDSDAHGCCRALRRYGDASEYRAMLHQRLTHSGSFAFWEACAEESPGHVFALSGSQMAQLDGLFGGSGVRTAVTAIIYTSDGDAESLACTTCDPAPLPAPPSATLAHHHAHHHLHEPRLDGSTVSARPHGSRAAQVRRFGAGRCGADGRGGARAHGRRDTAAADRRRRGGHGRALRRSWGGASCDVNSARGKVFNKAVQSRPFSLAIQKLGA